MSKLYDSFKTPEEDMASSWFLKVSDDTVFGPVNITTLTGWAAQNRLAPGDEVSNNQKDWAPVETLPETEIVWFVQLNSGRTYGPINQMAAPYLARQNILDEDALLKNRATGEEILVRTLIEAEAQQLAMIDVMETTEAYHDPVDKPSTEQSPEKEEEARESLPPKPEPPRIPVSQMALELSGYVSARAKALSVLSLPSKALDKGRILGTFTGKDRSINKRLTRKVKQLHEQLVTERERVQKLQQELLGKRATIEESASEITTSKTKP